MTRSSTLPMRRAADLGSSDCPRSHCWETPDRVQSASAPRCATAPGAAVTDRHSDSSRSRAVQCTRKERRDCAPGQSMRENTERDRQAWKATLYALGKSYSLMRNKEQLLSIDTMDTNSLVKENTTRQKKNGVTAFQRPLFPLSLRKMLQSSID